MNMLRGQQHAISRLAAEINVQTGWLTRTGGDCDLQLGQAVQTAISSANPRWERTTKSGRHQRSWATSNVQDRISTECLRKTTGFLIAAYGSAFWPVIEWVEDQDNVITNEALDQPFGPQGAKPVDDVLEKSE